MTTLPQPLDRVTVAVLRTPASISADEKLVLKFARSPEEPGMPARSRDSDQLRCPGQKPRQETTKMVVRAQEQKRGAADQDGER